MKFGDNSNAETIDSIDSSYLCFYQCWHVEMKYTVYAFILLFFYSVQ